MNFKNWLYLFGTTLLAGAAAGLAAGLILQLTDRDVAFMGISAEGFNVFQMLLAGLMFSVFSQMCFFAYMMLNYIAISIIRQKYGWNFVQVFLIIVIVFDAGYIRYIHFADKPLWSYLITPVIVLIAGWAVALWKVRMTNRTAFIPTLFLMTAFTLVEAAPAFQRDNAASTFFMIAPLFVCNAWQILRLHKLVGAKKS